MKVLAFPKPRRDAFIEQFMHLVEVAAKATARRLPPSFELDDLISEGYIGLIHAADTFSPSAGYPAEKWAKAKINFQILESVRRRNYTASTMEPFDPARERGGGSEDELIAEIDARKKRDLMCQAMGDVEPRARVVLQCYYRDGRQIADAAEQIQCGPSNASKIHHHGLRELSGALRRRGVVVSYQELRQAVVQPVAA